MLVKSAPGLRVRDPQTQGFLPDEGLEVSPHDPTWARLISDGDVVIITPTEPAAEHAEGQAETHEADPAVEAHAADAIALDNKDHP